MISKPEKKNASKLTEIRKAVSKIRMSLIVYLEFPKDDRREKLGTC